MNSIKDIIIKFIDSEGTELNLPMVPIDNIDEVMKELGFTDNDDYDLNGWECTFWKSYSKNGLKLTFNGSLYYGQFKVWKDNE